MSCDKRGDFSPLQCTTTRSNGKMCRCVSMNGTTIQSTERSVQSTSDAPDCGQLLNDQTSVGGILARFDFLWETNFMYKKQLTRKMVPITGRASSCLALLLPSQSSYLA